MGASGCAVGTAALSCGWATGGGVDACGNRVGGATTGCAAMAAEPHEVGATGAAAGLLFQLGAVATGGGAAFGRLPEASEGIGALGTGAENVAGIDAIARGFTNGMTLADTPLAGTDDGCFGADTERDPVGGGAARRVADVTSASTSVLSSLSKGRGTWGIVRSCVASSRASIRGRDFRGCIWSDSASAKQPPADRLRSSLIAYACAHFALGSSGSDWAGRSSPTLRAALDNCTERGAREVQSSRHRSC